MLKEKSCFDPQMTHCLFFFFFFKKKNHTTIYLAAVDL